MGADICFAVTTEMATSFVDDDDDKLEQRMDVAAVRKMWTKFVERKST